MAGRVPAGDVRETLKVDRGQEKRGRDKAGQARTLWPWASPFSSQEISFLIYRMGGSEGLQNVHSQPLSCPAQRSTGHGQAGACLSVSGWGISRSPPLVSCQDLLLFLLPVPGPAQPGALLLSRWAKD